MAESEQSLHSLALQIKDEIRGLWRFKWQAAAAAWAILALGCAAVFSLPNQYQASSKFFVDASSRLSPLVQGLTVETNIDTQMAFVRQMMLSRPRLTKLAASPELAGYSMSSKQRVELVEALRDNALITPVRGGEMGKGLLLEFSFQHPNRDVALFVVKSMVDSFFDEVQEINVDKANEAVSFLASQLKELEGKLTSADTRLANFKRSHFGALPGQGGDYFSRMQTERESLDRARSQLGVLQSQRDTLNRQLRGQAPLVPTGRSPIPEIVLPSQRDIDARIKESEAKLEDLLLRFTDKHPEVVSLRATIKDLQERRSQELAAIRAGGTGNGSISTSENPVYQAIQQQLARLEVDIAAAREEAGQHERRVSELQRSVNTAPEVEAELASLNRDYGVTKAQYESILAALQKARISGNAEESGVVKVQSIEPPAAKSKPVGPKRMLMLLLVFMASLGGGLAVAFGLHQFRPVFGSVASVGSQLGLPVLGTVSLGRTLALESVERRDLRLYIFVFGAYVLAMALAFVLRDWAAGLSLLIAR